MVVVNVDINADIFKEPNKIIMLLSINVDPIMDYLIL